MKEENNKGFSYIFCVFGTLLFLESIELGFINETWYPGHELKCLVWAVFFYIMAFGFYTKSVRKIWFLALVLGWLFVHRFLYVHSMIAYLLNGDIAGWGNLFLILVMPFWIGVELVILEKKRKQ